MEANDVVYRPPSEADSLILRVAFGCPYNRCTFCGMYRGRRFRVRPIEEVAAEIAAARQLFGPRGAVRRVFLADGDALFMKTEHLLEVIDLVAGAFPDLHRVSAYATPQSLLRKTPGELEQLRERGLFQLYLGVESGSEEVLRRLKKGVTSDEMIAAGRRAVASGMKLSTMIILGAGGRELSLEHARASAEVLSAIDPRFISTLTLMLVPGTPLHEDAAAGRFEPPTPRQAVYELRELIAGTDVSGAIFRSNHVSNFVRPAGTLPKDKARLLRELDAVL